MEVVAMMGQTFIARELLGRETSQFQAVLGPMGIVVLREMVLQDGSVP